MNIISLKKYLVVFFIFFLFLICGHTESTCFADGHYVPGVIGIRDGTVTPPGVFLFGYLPFYSSERVIASDSSKIPVKVNVQNLVPEILWSTGKKLFGGDLAIVLLPSFIRLHLNSPAPPGVNTTKFYDTDWGFGDLNFAPLVLGWRDIHYELTTGVLLSAPTGDFTYGDATNTGLGYWSSAASARLHYYSDQQHSTVLMLQALYEINGSQQNSKFQPGDNFALEWGISESLGSGFDLGIAGYDYWQISDDRNQRNPIFSGREQVHAIGPQLSYWIEFQKLLVSMRSLQEFKASSRSEGSITTFNVSYQF